MKSKDLKSLCETIANTVEETQSKRLAEGYINSLTEKARQVYSSINEEKEEDEDEKEESPAEEKAEDKAEMLMKKLAAKALKKAKKKAATNEEIELAEKAAPGYENWASDPKVKRSFKKQYGKRWKQVMYAKSWKMSKMDEETEQLDELSTQLLHRAKYAAKIRRKLSKKTGEALDKKFTRELQKRGDIPQKPKTWAERESQWMGEDVQLDEEWGGGFQSYRDAHREVQAGLRREASAHRKMVVSDIKAVLSGKMTKNAFTRKHKIKFGEHTLAKRMAAKAKARRLAESEQLDEAGYKRLMRLKKAAYTAQDKAYRSFTADQNKPARLARAAAEREAQVAAGMARRGGASQEAVKGGGSRIGKSGKYTQKAGKLANQRDKALASFRTKGRIAQLLDKREDQSRKKRERQQAQAKFNMDARHGYFGHEIAPEIAKAGMRARYNYEKKYGRLKGK